MTASKIVPCPFCGGDADLHDDGDEYMRIVCPCTGFGPLRQTEHEAIDAWNARTPEAATITSLTAEVEKRAWQPIETAPKDQRILLLADGDVYLGEWNAYRSTPQFEPELWEGPVFDDGHFTHWMPLPDPPQSNLPIRSE
jgi:hypothetical protein